MSFEATAIPSSVPTLETFEAIWLRHGHRCPMSTLGGRLGHAARRRLPNEDGVSLRAIYRINTCAVDGIAVTTGCSESAGTLTIEDRGRHQLMLYDANSGSAVEVEIRPETLAMSAVYRRFDDALERERPLLTEDQLAQRLREKECVLNDLLPKLRTLPDDELLFVRILDVADAAIEG